MSIGDNTYINPNSLIAVKSSVSIGKDCAISWNCQILDDDGHGIVINGQKKEQVAPIVIGDKVWIGSNCTIKKGVTIGGGSVIAGGSIVTKDVAEGVVVAGVPAKVVGQNVEWQPKY